MRRYLLDSHVALRALTRSRKRERGLLDAPEGSLAAAFTDAGAELLPLHAEHVEDGLALEAQQDDPFDRMPVRTARVERMKLLTRDAELLRRAAPLRGPLLQEA